MTNETKRARGRPEGGSIYDPAFADQARKLRARGANDAECAEWFGVSLSTIRQWLVIHDDFGEAYHVGSDVAVERLERTAYERAIGYSFDSEKILVSDGRVFREPIVEHVPPDSNMLRWIMANKAPDRWKLNPSGRQQLDLGDLQGQSGLAFAARQTLLALSRGDLSPDETRMVVEALNRLGEHQERVVLAAQVEALEADPKRLEHNTNRRLN